MPLRKSTNSLRIKKSKHWRKEKDPNGIPKLVLPELRFFQRQKDKSRT